MNEVTGDTPTKRESILGMQIAELDAMLDEIRSSRLRQVQALERVAKSKASEGSLQLRMKFAGYYEVALKQLANYLAYEEKCSKAINKLRALQIELGE